jgi:hypothetical protein
MDYINRDYSHYRKSSPQNTLQLWQTIYQINYELNEKSFIESMIEKMRQNFNRVLNQNDCQKLIEDALDDNLITYINNTHGLRYSLVLISF